MNSINETDAIFDIDKKTVTLNSGYEMPLNGLGTYSLKDEICVQSVSSALASGVRLIDTAHAYDIISICYFCIIRELTM